MKKLFLFCAVAALSTVAFAQSKITDAVKFASETINLGKIKQNQPATATFEITNISTKPLLIEQANPSCGCTVADYTKEPIAPGEKGFIKATYNAAGEGEFTKSVTVKFAGIDETESLKISGEVILLPKIMKPINQNFFIHQNQKHEKDLISLLCLTYFMHCTRTIPEC